MEAGEINRILIFYHSPCLDGAYSLLSCLLGLCSLLRSKLTPQSICNIVKGDLEVLNVGDPTPLSDLDEAYGLSNSSISFVPYRHTEANYQSVGVLSSLQETTMLIFLDCCAGKLTAELVKKAGFTLMIDHHKTTLSIIQDFTPDILSKFKLVYDESLAACVLSFNYFSSIVSYPLLESELEANLKKVLELVGAHDIKKDYNDEAAAFVCGIFKRRMDFNIFNNSRLLRDLLDVNIEVLKEIGRVDVEVRKRIAQTYAASRRLIDFSSCIEGKTIIGYAVEIKDATIRNEVGEVLAEISVNDGHSNIGCVYYQDNDGSLKVSLRSKRDLDEEGFCHKIAERFKGGGHPTAASFFIDQKRFRKLFI
eukprot:TRINITY_DN10474_c1_g1_i1.p1 TRINITY_DN10474_c1_g1~~TRINITY_DN10474_c1_g1_i1.p1  ORF type:complete len:365 (+),score=46.27 TRINITY_DN10474_c1_g1_i1:85-1179(+)